MLWSQAIEPDLLGHEFTVNRNPGGDWVVSVDGESGGSVQDETTNDFAGLAAFGTSGNGAGAGGFMEGLQLCPLDPGCLVDEDCEDWNPCTADICLVGFGCGHAPEPDGMPCGDESLGYTCQYSLCLCTPECGGKECGDNGCGGICGDCAPEATCSDGICLFQECFDGNSVDWDGCNNGTIVEFQQNSFWESSQAHPDVASLPDGRVVCVWQSGQPYDGPDGSGNAVSGAIYDATGMSGIGEFQVNTTVEGQQHAPSTASQSDGRFIVVWESPDGSNFGIFLQTFAPSGDLLGGEIQVNSISAGDQREPAIAVMDNGNFLVAWHGNGSDDPDGVYCQLFSADSLKIGPQFLVNQQVQNEQRDAVVASLSGGKSVVAWENKGNSGVYARFFDEAAQALGNEIQLVAEGGNQEPAVLALSSGGFIMAWSSTGYGSVGKDIYAQVFSEAGVEQHPVTRINSTVDGDQSYPSLVHSGSDVVVHWTGYGEDGSEVYGVRVSSDDLSAVGEEYQVNSFSPGFQARARSAMVPGGEYLVVWESSDQDGAYLGIFAQRFSSNDEKLYR